MNNFLKNIDLKTIIILVLILIILFLKGCGGNSTPNDKTKIVKIDGKKYQVVKHVVDTTYVPVTKIVYKEGKTIYKDVPIYVNVPTDVDTNQILKDFYTKNTYKDTLYLDEGLGYVSVNDTIFQNQILNRTWDSHVNKIIVKDVQIVKELPRTQLYAGGVLGFNTQLNSVFIGPKILLKTKNENMFSFNISVGTGKEILYQGGIYKVINIKK